MNWYLSAITKNYFNFGGRARRSEYWWFTLVYLGLLILFFIADSLLGSSVIADTVHRVFPVKSAPAGVIGDTGDVMLAFYLFHMIPYLAVGVRRLHDIDRSGWWILIAFVPFFGIFIFLYWALSDGKIGPNEYGPDPKMPLFNGLS